MVRKLTAILAADVVGYSRLMELDEAGTLAALKANLRALIEPEIAAHHGRMVKLMGDGALVEFASVVDAVDCAATIQRAMVDRNKAIDRDRRIDYRIGIHLGDVIVEGDDLFGDGVNIAARLEGLSAPGGICLSQQAFDQVEAKLNLDFRDMGEQHLKNIARPVRAYGVALDGTAVASAGRPEPQQKVHFCTARDGARIAYATVGDGPPLVKAANWLSHLDYDWESPIWRHMLRAFAERHYFVRYDARGNGLSDWDVEEISFDTNVGDLEAVVDASGLDRFTLYGVSQGCAVSIMYALRHPQRVDRLVLYGGFARGRLERGSQEEIDQSQAMLTLIQMGWGKDNPAFRQMFTSIFVPGATCEQEEWFNELQRMTASAENAARIRRAADRINIDDLLPQVSVPTLVLHCRNDAAAPFDEGRRMAARIPNARFVALESDNHLILEDEPAWPRFIAEVRGFLAEPA